MVPMLSEALARIAEEEKNIRELAEVYRDEGKLDFSAHLMMRAARIREFLELWKR